MRTFREADLSDDFEKKKISIFLESLGIKYEEEVDYTIVYEENGEILGTASKFRNVLKCFGVHKKIQGENITAKLVTSLVNKLYDQGIFHYFLFTKMENEELFSSMGFNLLYRGGYSSLFEKGLYKIDDSLEKMKKEYKIQGENSAIVLNCNPFTKGHRYLIEEASKISENLLLFIVEEDKSIFPFQDRFDIVKEGIKDLQNVKLIKGGEYIISSASFPTYFLKKKEEGVLNQASIDAGIFAKYFCSKFNIKDRYVGEEPLDYVTNLYNNALDKELHKYLVNLHIIPRLKINDEVISASRVRKYLKDGEYEKAGDLLPKATIEYLKSGKGQEVIKKIERS